MRINPSKPVHSVTSPVDLTFDLSQMPPASSSPEHLEFQCTVATVSWIPGTMCDAWGLPETDHRAEWGASTTFDTLVSSEGEDKAIYRFTNILATKVLVNVRTGRIEAADYLSSDEKVGRQQRGMSIARSFLGTKVELILHKCTLPVFIVSDGSSATFRQVAACRTRAPEKISSIGGAMSAISASGLSTTGGLGLAGWLAMGGAHLAPVLVGAVGAGLSAIATPIVGKAISFAPIWTDITLHVSVAGRCTLVVKHSTFPSTTVYLRKGRDEDFDRVKYIYDGAAGDRFEDWVYWGWDSYPDGYDFRARRGRCARKKRVNALFGLIKRANYIVLPPLVRCLVPAPPSEKGSAPTGPATR